MGEWILSRRDGAIVAIRRCGTVLFGWRYQSANIARKLEGPRCETNDRLEAYPTLRRGIVAGGTWTRSKALRARLRSCCPGGTKYILRTEALGFDSVSANGANPADLSAPIFQVLEFILPFYRQGFELSPAPFQPA